MDNIYLVYSSEKETEESLNRLVNTVMVKAGFNKDKIIFKEIQQFKEEISQGKENIPSFVIALSKTYTDLTADYSKLLDVSIFEFFSKDYADVDSNIYLTGLMLSVEDIFKDQYKRYAWKTITTFYSHYSKAIAQQETIVEEVQTEEVKEEIIQEQVETEPLKVEEVQETTAVKASPEDPITEVDLLTFYQNVKLLISQFNTVQEQIKLIEPLLNEKN